MHIRIPIKRFLRQYLVKQLGCEKLELRKISPFEAALSENNLRANLQKKLSDTIFPLLQSTKNYDLEFFLSKPEYTLVGLNLTDNMLKQKRVCIRHSGVNAINHVLYELVITDLNDRLFSAIDNDERQDLIIYGFMAEHDMDEDMIRADSLKKAAYRKRLELEEKIFKNNSVSQPLVLNLSFDQKLINR